MNVLELTIHLSNEYDVSFDSARALNDLRKCRCWFDRKNIINNEVTVTLTSQGISIFYCTTKGQIQESCTYDSVLSVTEMYGGIMLRLSHKRLLFLQAADNRKDTELLMQAVVMLSDHCKYIFRKSSLRIEKADLFTQIKFRLRPKQGYYDGTGHSNPALLFLICVTFFIATVFILQPVNNRIIPKSEALSLTLTYKEFHPSYKRGSIRYIDLKSVEQEEFTIDGSCCNSDLIERLSLIPEGTQVQLLVHPESHSILQLEVNGDILLEFHASQNKLWRESVTFAVLGLFMYAIAGGLVIGMVRKK